ncbi:Benzoyl-CoA reductase subunit BadG [Paramagnetospirillum magnetotacticum MS-1]|uniref:Benzoyl-CoA reductase subunit BadG n=1 Tax=Paramagnetospirillum magnetotacticum MS-1 TaxID=272627 RepID=A0A0C2V2X3_PARME|nr:acyl-CoA dehydratase activase [Paramagnetospirillum magnetotacticum]KIL99436.1 Benzoyl-CoA reductase subunit BadG [Paramagnetospirillum magnetotacticum MS-1]
MTYFAGIDIGSTAIKVALVHGDGTLAGAHVTASGSLFHKNAKEALQGLLDRHGLRREQVRYLIATGYGRKLFKEADDSISEITANAIGAHEAGKAFGGVRTIINIGGQDSKAIQIDGEGGVVNFAMNDKCAAGTGRFLDVAARNLDLDLEDLGDIHFNGAGAALSINSTCTVFAESEIIGLLANGHGKGEIVAGIHYSIARRTVRLAKRVGIEDRVYFDGGPALNKGLVAAIEDELGRQLVVPEHPQTTTAFGAAILARSEYLAEQGDEA